jgi:hypothetical protein
MVLKNEGTRGKQTPLIMQCKCLEIFISTRLGYLEEIKKGNASVYRLLEDPLVPHVVMLSGNSSN